MNFETIQKTISRYKQFNVMTKFNLLFSPIIILCLLFSIIFYTTITHTIDRIKFMKDVAYTEANYAKDLSFSVLRVQMWVCNLSATRGKSTLTEGAANAQSAANDFNIIINRYIDSEKNNKAKIDLLNEIKIKFNAFYKMGSLMADNYVNYGEAVGNMYMAEFNKTGSALQVGLTTLNSASNNQYRETVIEIEKYNNNRIIIILLLSVFILTTIVSIFMVINMDIIRPLKNTSSMLKDVLEGQKDFTKRLQINRSDEVGEIGRYVNSFLDSTQQMLKNFKNHAQNVKDFSHKLADISNQAADEINHINSAMENVLNESNKQVQITSDACTGAFTLSEMAQNMGQAVSDQKSSTKKAMDVGTQANSAMAEITNITTNQMTNIEKVVNIVTQMTGAVDQVAMDASKVAENSKQTKDIAINGDKIIAKTVVGMNNIQEKVLVAAEKILELGNNSNKIGEIIDVIDDISGQTNLLALNAAIEAARAGEHGRGFAVVADEVRKLAEKSSRATKEIGSLIKSIQEATDVSVNYINESTIEVKNGAKLVNEARNALSEIIDAVKDTVMQIENISGAGEEMAASANEVFDNVKNLSELASSTTAAVEEVAASSENLVDELISINSVSNSIENVTVDMNSNLTQFSMQIAEILSASSINASAAQEVSSSTQNVANSISQLKTSSIEIVNLSQALNDQLSPFKID